MSTPSSSKVSRTNQITRKRVQACQPWMRAAWGIHFAVTLAVLVISICRNNGTRKYIPVSSTNASTECQKSFVNTLSPSSDGLDAFICCSGIDEHGICAPTPKHHILSGRLTRFPEAWGLPLLPLVFRWAVASFQGANANMESLLRRLGFYILVMNFRGWILFLLFNGLEDHFGGAHDRSNCWYGELLGSDQPGCYGRQFDFSDHTVLFFAQMLPVALVEVIHYLVAPIQEAVPMSSGAGASRSWLARVTSFILVVYLIELYIVILMSVQKTAEYFHTGPEILVGYVMSMMVQLPLCFLQCFPYWQKARHLIFGFPR